MEITSDQIQLLLETGRALVAPIKRKNGEVVVPVANGITLQTLPKEEQTDVDQRVTIRDDESFYRYVSSFKLPGRSIIFADYSCPGELTAVIDYHKGATGDGTPAMNDADAVGRCAHVVRYQLRRGRAFMAWLVINERQLDQTVFAEFLQENDVDVVSPDSAILTELVNDLSVTRVSGIKKKINLGNGCVELHCMEEDSASSGGKPIVVPKKITVRVALFEGGETVDLDAFFSYRITNSKLTFGIRFVRWEDSFEEAARNKIEDLAARTAVPFVYGSI